jgi:putative transposase
MMRRMLAAGRLHLYAASIRFERGRWWVSLTGLAAPFHPVRRSPAGRHPNPAGIDRGVKALAVVANTEGVVLHAEQGVKALQHAQTALRRANKALARTKRGSGGRRKAKQRLTRIHARVAHLRSHTAHQLSYWAATTLTRLTVEDLHVAGMTRLRSLARSVADAGMADLGRLLAYKARWYRLELVVADRWYPSSKTCSGCGHVDTSLGLGERTYRCQPCGLVLDRDVNAAVNLARWPDQHSDHPPLVAAA